MFPEKSGSQIIQNSTIFRIETYGFGDPFLEAKWEYNIRCNKYSDVHGYIVIYYDILRYLLIIDFIMIYYIKIS